MIADVVIGLTIFYLIRPVLIVGGIVLVGIVLYLIAGGKDDDT